MHRRLEFQAVFRACEADEGIAASIPPRMMTITG